MAILGLALGLFIVLWFGARTRASELQAQVSAVQAEGAKANDALREQLARVKPYLEVADAIAESERIRSHVAGEATKIRAEAAAEVELLKKESREQVRERMDKADAQLELAGAQASKSLIWRKG